MLLALASHSSQPDFGFTGRGEDDGTRALFLPLVLRNGTNHALSAASLGKLCVNAGTNDAGILGYIREPSRP